MKKDKGLYQVRLGGFGGQGVILASRILGEALSRDGYNVLQTQSYGIEARGGASCGEVIYGNNEINTLRVVTPDLLLALSQGAIDEYLKNVEPGGFVFYDTYLIKEKITSENHKVYGLPFTEIAISEMGNEIYTNLIALGFINGVTKMVNQNSLEDALIEQIKSNKENNCKAMQKGYDEAIKMTN